MKKMNTPFAAYLPRFSYKAFRLLALLAFFCAPAGPAAAHGSLHEAIGRKSRQIEENPGDMLLVFERGMLYQEHGDIGLAMEDFRKVLRQEPAYYVCHLPLAQLCRDSGLLREALFHINYFLEQEPDNPFGYETRASVWQREGHNEQAVADLRRMIALKNDNAIRPDDYFRLADALLAARPGQYGPAIAALEEGLQRLGDVVSLQSRLASLEMEAGQYAAALARIDRIMEPMARKDSWLAKRTEVIRRMQQQNTAAAPPQAGREEAGEQPDSQADAAPLPADPPDPASYNLLNVVRGPYLQSGAPTAMTVKWRTDNPANSKVWYGAHPSSLTQSMEQSGSRTDHEVRITGLEPGARYYYAVGSSEGVLAGASADHYFTTSPPAGTIQPVRAWVLGDCGTANSNARAVRDGYYAYAGNNQTDMILLLGDNAYDDGKDSEYQKALFENMYEDQLIKSVLWSAPGNHDYGSASAASQTGPYYDIFTFPRNGEAGGLASGTEAYYSFDYANIHFVVLDSHDSGREPGDPMLLWLENDLHASSQDWLVVLFHHPPYSKGSHDSDDESKLIDMRENVLPILEAAGVDLVLSGHSHSYERSYLLHGHYGNSGSLQPSMILDDGDGREDGDGAYRKDESGPAAGQGAVYVVAGSSGKVSDAPLNHPVMYYNALTLGSLSMEVNDKRLDLKFIGTEGEVLDQFTLLKYFPNGAPPAVAVTSPANGAFYPTLQTISLQAQASDSDGEVESVVFYVNGDSIGVSHSAPYTLDWTPPMAGDYTIRARARDDAGNAVNSSEVAISIGYIEACSRISSRADDAEENDNGNMSLSSSDLELINDPSDGNQTLGLRFPGLNIPRNAFITEAWIQFTVDDDNNSGPCSLAIYGQAADDAGPFSSSDQDISSRPRTQASVHWEPAEWNDIGAAGPAQRTPNLASIIQEIIAREGFTPASAIGFLIEGQGRRTAEAYDGEAYAAPQLCVRYELCASSALQLSSSADSICPGETVTLSAGPASRYLWSTGATTASIAVQPQGSATFSVTGWDVHGCPASAEIAVNVHPAPELSFDTDTVFFCPGESVTIFAPDGFAQYQWSTGSAGQSLNLSASQSLSLTVTDANGCTAAAVLEVRQRPPLNLQINAGPNPLCAGQTAALTAGPAARYLWNTGATTAGIMVQPQESTVYSLTAWDAYDCPASAEIAVNVHPAPEFSFDADTLFFCPDGFATAFAPEGFAQYQWSNGSNSPALSLNTPQTLSLTVTDANGCTASSSLEVRQRPPLNLQINASANPLCPGQAATLSAGPAARYLWNTGATTAGITVQPQESTVYSLTAWDAYDCPSTAEINITAAPAPELSFDADTAFFCSGQEAEITAPAGYSAYEWSTGDTTPAITVSAAGLLSLTVANEFGCTARDSLQVQEITPPAFSLEPEGDSLTVTGLDDMEQYEILWSTGATAAVIFPDSSGWYCATVTDVSGCASQACLEVEVMATRTVAAAAPERWEVFPNPFDSQIRVKPVQDTADLYVMVFDVLGRPVPFEPELESDVLALSFQGLPPGAYTVVISDKAGKTAMAKVMIKP